MKKIYTIFKFKLLENIFYLPMEDKYVPYIQEYFDSIENGYPDKISIINKYYHENVSSIQIPVFLNNGTVIYGSSSNSGIVTILNNIEITYKDIIDSAIRDVKIKKILHD